MHELIKQNSEISTDTTLIVTTNYCYQKSQTIIPLPDTLLILFWFLHFPVIM